MEAEIKTIDNLLVYLFADKKAVYIDDIIVNTDDSYEVSWCLDFTLKNNNPQWHDTTATRTQLIDFIIANRLNYWEAFRYDDATGSVQPFTNCTHDIDTFLDENYPDVVKEFLSCQLRVASCALNNRKL
ncbi:hypothetical protein ACFGVR_10490 [Mucilaginibacter sp. AW1-3]